MDARGGGRSAFTLIELLVTVGVIAVLAALSLSAFAGTQRKAKETHSLANMRQLGSALLIYAGDREGAVPRDKIGSSTDTWSVAANPSNGDVWYNSLPRLLGRRSVADFASDKPGFYEKGNLLWSPAAEYPKNSAAQNSPLFAVAMNSKLNQARLQNIVAPSKTVLLLDAGLPGETKTFPKQSGYNGQPAVFASRFIARHRKAGLVVLADGHAELVDAAEAIDPASGKAYFPQTGRRLHWTPDPADNPN